MRISIYFNGKVFQIELNLNFKIFIISATFSNLNPRRRKQGNKKIEKKRVRNKKKIQLHVSKLKES